MYDDQILRVHISKQLFLWFVFYPPLVRQQYPLG